MSLADFDAIASSGGSYRPPGGGGFGRGAMNDANLQLPTGPSMRDPDEEDQGRAPGQLGGAFKDYGGDRGRYDRDDRRGGFDRDDRRGGFDRDDRRGGFGRDRYDDRDPRDREDREPEGPSRADADDNWGRSKRDTSPRRGDRYDDRRGGYDRGYDRYDDRRGGDRFDDRRSRSPSPERDWGALRNRPGPPPRDDRDRRGGGFRGSSRSPSPERDWGALRNRPGPPPRGGRDRSRSPSPERDWNSLRNRTGPPPRDDRDDRRGPRPGARADAAGDRWGKTDLPSRDDRDDRDDRERGGRPRLNLKARSADADARAASGGGGGIFGGTRPREAALKEAGRDFIKEDLALSRGAGVRRKEHPDEKAIKDDIAEMNARLATMEDGEEKEKLKTTVGEAETALAKLSLELDDKVRFAQRERREKDAAEGAEGAEGANGQRRGGRAAGEARERDTERSWGEGKAERQAARGGRGGDRKPREERGPREPRVVKVAEENTVKIAASGFAALAVDDDDN